ncbi:MAG: hypothetical protein M3Q03_01675, partial [Chloroflexota bacterium]|nr:hypothetical protein [Chloroflexota bacterium]
MCAACYAKRRNGDNNPNWKGMADVMMLVRGWFARYWRPQVFARDEYRCQACGDGRGGNLQAHHRIPVSEMVMERREAWQPHLDTAKGRAAFARRLLMDYRFTSFDNGIT